ncbi:MAG: hypothetical protein HY226_04160, partial [Candidatus Vogelbacteria bacterium]|nr:hypothetical protein [Candidatus Vogelbacteria bacterium]
MVQRRNFSLFLFSLVAIFVSFSFLGLNKARAFSLAPPKIVRVVRTGYCNSGGCVGNDAVYFDRSFGYPVGNFSGFNNDKDYSAQRYQLIRGPSLADTTVTTGTCYGGSLAAQLETCWLSSDIAKDNFGPSFQSDMGDAFPYDVYYHLRIIGPKVSGDWSQGYVVLSDWSQGYKSAYKDAIYPPPYINKTAHWTLLPSQSWWAWLVSTVFAASTPSITLNIDPLDSKDIGATQTIYRQVVPTVNDFITPDLPSTAPLCTSTTDSICIATSGFTGTSYTDNNVVTGKIYSYRSVAVLPDSTLTSPSNPMTVSLP